MIEAISCQYGLVCLILLTLPVFKHQINLYIEVTDSALVKGTGPKCGEAGIFSWNSPCRALGYTTAPLQP